MRRRFLLLWLASGLMWASGQALSAQVTDNPHGALPEGLACTSCHTTDGWTPLRTDLTFDHASTGFTLEGRHASAACAGCHAGLRFDGAEAESGGCASCHNDVHRGTIDRACVSCHTTDSFIDVDPAGVHPADFPLEGAHLQTSCESCHTDDLGGAFRPLDGTCRSCHMDDYSSAFLVDHQALGFSTDCTGCHSTLSFRDVAFDHFVYSGGFELVGRHAQIPCTACHSGPDGSVPVPVLDAEECFACHVDDYDREHGGTGFPSDCLACHTPFTWDGASFAHSFPIFSGPHREPWDSCADCHEVPGDYTSFSCFQCHGRTETDDHHREEPRYVYESLACLSCHPTGRSD